MVYLLVNYVYFNCSDFRHLCVDNCDSYEGSIKLKTPKRIVNAMIYKGVNVNLDGYTGDVIVGNDPDGANAVYIRVGFLSLEYAKNLAKRIAKKGLVFNDRDNDNPSISL